MDWIGSKVSNLGWAGLSWVRLGQTVIFGCVASNRMSKSNVAVYRWDGLGYEL